MRISKELVIESQKVLKVKVRLPHQTTSFIYKALDIAESQIVSQHEEIERLLTENRRLKMRNKR